MVIWSSNNDMVYLTKILQIGLTLGCIALAFWALQAFRFDLFLKNPRSGQAKTLMILLSVVLGYGTAEFLMVYGSWAFM